MNLSWAGFNFKRLFKENIIFFTENITILQYVFIIHILLLLLHYSNEILRVNMHIFQIAMQKILMEMVF